MRRSGALGLILVAGACGGPAPDTAVVPAPAGDVVATWTGGSASLAQIEARLVRARTPACRASRREHGAVEQLVPCYREIAEELFLETRLGAGAGATPAAAAPSADDAQLEGRLLLGVFEERLRDSVEVSDADVKAYLAQAPDLAHRPQSLTLWNLFRRDEDAAHPEATTEFLREIAARAKAGEAFPALAREYSHSETQLRDGLVGAVSRGQLPRRLEDVAFALPEGGVSDPIRVRGGAVLLYVRNVSRAREPSPDAQLRVARQRLETERRAKAIEARLKGVSPPEGSLILEPDALVARLDAGDPETAVLEMGGARLTVEQMRRTAGLSGSAKAAELDADKREGLVAAYGRQVESFTLAWNLRTAQDAVAQAVRAEAAPRLREERLEAAVDAWLQEQVRQRAAADPAELRRYFDDNRSHYRSPLRLRLELWTLPFGADPPAQLAAMERLRASLVAGETTLPAAAAQLGGEVSPLGWRALDDLPELPGKAQSLLTQTAVGSFTPPYHEDEALHMVHVVARDEPHAQEYEAVAERVLDDYARRFGQKLSRDIVDAVSKEAGFEFLDARLRQLLAPGPGAG